MVTRRMLIEDFEVMGHAQRAFLAELDARETLSDEERADAELLRADTRLSGAIFMEWELDSVFDAALCRALAWGRGRVDFDLRRQGIPEDELPRYVEGRLAAIDRVIERLSPEA